jgi:hypothetical protein
MVKAATLKMLCIPVCLLLFGSTASAQVTVYNNFGPGQGGWDYNYGTGWTVAGVNVPTQYGVEQAMGFQSTADGVVTDIWVAFFYVPSSTFPDTVTIRLTRNPQGLPPDSADVMEEWILTEFFDWYQWDPPHHLQGNGTSYLQEGENYWLWAIGGETTWCGWCLNVDPGLTCLHTLRREGEDWLPIANETASAFRVDVIQTLLSVSLTPATVPIQIPANGGTFEFNIAVENTGTSPAVVDLWTMVTLPDGSEFGPLILVADYTLNAGQTIDRDRTQNVPGVAPAGMYTYDAYLGTFPYTLLSEDHFEWEKLAVNEGGTIAQDWSCWGEDFDGETILTPVSMPEDFILYPPHPNPFNPTTTLTYHLPRAASVELNVYDVIGNLVETLSSGWHPAGAYHVAFDGSDLASGVYLGRLNAGEFTQTQKMVLLK